MALLVVVLSFGVLVGVFVVLERRAAGRAAEFCSRYRTGDEIAVDPQAIALQKGAEPSMTGWSESAPEHRWFGAAFVGAPPFSRYLCSIESIAGKVGQVEVRHVD